MADGNGARFGYGKPMKKVHCKLLYLKLILLYLCHIFITNVSNPKALSMKKTLLLLLVALSLNTIFLFFNACSPFRPMCTYYTSGSLVPMNNADSIPRVADAQGVLAKAFYLDLVIWDTSYNCMRYNARLPVNAAYAEHINHTKHMRIDSIVLTSDHDFDAAHPAGSDLKNLFNKLDSTSAKGIFPVVGINHLYLLHTPSDTGTHIFTIRVYQSDSLIRRNFIATSSPVKLLL